MSYRTPNEYRLPKEYTDHRLLTREEEVRLVQEKPRAAYVSMLIEHNIRLVIKIAKGYYKRTKDSGMDLDDLISEGIIGLKKAAEGFSIGEGVRFQTYARWWIKKTIRKFIPDYAKPMHVPNRVIQNASQWRWEEHIFEAVNGRKPSNDELAELCGIEPKQYKQFGEQRARFSRVEKNLSLNYERGESDETDGSSLAEICEDKHAEKTIERLMREEAGEIVVRLLSRLEKREAEILRMRYGLNGYQPMTLQEVGDVFRLSRERVRQIEMEAIRILQAEQESE